VQLGLTKTTPQAALAALAGGPRIRGHAPSPRPPGRKITRREFVILLGGAAIARPLAVRAQPPGKRYRIALFGVGSALPPKHWSILTDGLRELGWIDGRNIAFEQRYADNDSERLPELARELVRLDVDVIVTFGTLAVFAAKAATATIPIIMASAGDPVGSGLVASLARPGGNITGLSLVAPELGGKRLQLLREVRPAISRVAVLWNGANPYSALVFWETEAAAQTLGIEILSAEVRRTADFDAAFAAATRFRADALIAVEDPLTSDNARRIADFAAENGLPAIYGFRDIAAAGGLISYGADLSDLFRRCAGYVDKILKGAKPADLPIEQPTKFELVVNLKAAQALGLELPPTLIARADEVIE
jgi:putative tryptophan/tyrosine transport system substrate-binding protein